MGGFLSFMMPSAEGLLFHFEPGVVIPTTLQALVDKNSELALSQSWLMQQKGLVLPNKPIRITAIVQK